jgi:DNA-binding transcriptional regulator YdaS (Cro superfamily)
MDLKTYFAAHRQVDLARALGVTQGAVNQWSAGLTRIPLERAIEIERHTAGAVTCEELRPDLADKLGYLRGTIPATMPARLDIEPAAAGQGV